MFQQYFSNDSSSQLLKKPGVLAVISFEQRCEAPLELGVVPVGFHSLSGLNTEVLSYGSSTVERGEYQSCQWSIADDVMFVSTWITADQCVDIEAATFDAYISLYRTLEAKGFAHVFRIWNFIPNINSGDGDCEEYKKFCVGRANAFAELDIPESDFPAASGLGHHSKGAVVYLLASRIKEGCHFENPKQQSAYHYPREYGPKSPSFARATSIGLNGSDDIFISGTASILGHQTKAPEDLEQQLSITVDNIQALLAHVDNGAGPLNAIRVYLRHKKDYEQARDHLSKVLPLESINYLWADICRANLLVEIEAASKGTKLD